MPLFGANARGDFVAMPTCWPFDERSNPTDADCRNIILLNIDLLLGKKTLAEIKKIAENEPVFSIPGITFQTQCPMVVSMVLDVSERMVYWCEKRNWDVIMKQKIQ